MQFGLAEIIGIAGFISATIVGAFQVRLGYVQLRATRKEIADENPSDDLENDLEVQENLIQKAISQQLQGNLHESLLLVEQAKALSPDNLQVLKLEQQLRLELAKPYTNKSGKVIQSLVIQHSVTDSKSNAQFQKYQWQRITLLLLIAAIVLPVVGVPLIGGLFIFSPILIIILLLVFLLVKFVPASKNNLFAISLRLFLVLAIFLLTGFLYILLKWFGL